MQNEVAPLDHSPSVPPTSISMSSFGIVDDPDDAARKQRAKFFAIGMVVLIAVIGIFISRSPAEPVAKAKEEKPAVAAAAPPPPAPVASLPAPAASEKPKEEAKPAEEKAAEKKKPKSKRRAKT